MNDESTLKAEAVLLEKIRHKRQEVALFLRKMEPRYIRLNNIAIICGTISAALTAAPALGGKSVTDWLNEAFGLSQPIWQLLCLGAMVCSIAAIIATNLAKSQEILKKVINAQGCDAKLEGLEALVELGGLDLDSATKQFVEVLSDMPFV